MLKRGLEKNITKIYALDISSSFILVGPIIVLYMQERGLSFQEIMLLQSIFAFATFTLEVPTGYISDMLGRKKTLIIAQTIMVLSHLTYTFSTNFWHFLVGELLFALYFALISGTIDALIYDTLILLNKEHEYKKIKGNIHFFSFLAAATGAVVGSFLTPFGLKFVFLINTINLIITPLIALVLIEPDISKKEFAKSSLKDVIKAAKKTFFNGSNLKWVVLFSSVVYIFNQSVFWFYQPYLKLSGVDLVYFGIIFASFQIIAAISSKFAYKIEARLNLIGSFILIALFTGGSLILMGLVVMPFSFIFIYMQQFVRAVKTIIVSDAINKQSSSTFRATMLSVSSFLDKLLIAILMPILGYLEGVFSIKTTLIIMGVLSLILSFSIIYLLKKHTTLKD